MNESYGKGIFALAKNRDIDFEKEKVVSHGQFSMYNKCPRSWELRYVRKHRVSNESIDLIFGQAMHTVIQTWLHTIYTRTVKAGNEMDLDAMLLTEMKSEYKERLEKSDGVHFTSPEELSEYYTNGAEILKTLRAKRSTYFSTKQYQLMAIELPLSCSPDEDRPNIILQAFLDLIFYDTFTKKYLIQDIKTSKAGWNDYSKKDKGKVNQLVLYKKYFCDLYSIDPSRVDIQYFILKRKIDPDSLWPQKRIQTFTPSNGSMTIRKLEKEFKEFLDDCFDADGQYTDKKHPAIAGKGFYNCKFCVYKDNEELCPKSNRITEVN